MALEALRQPVINGYFIAGSVVGPGGFKLIKVTPEPIPVKPSYAIAPLAYALHMREARFLG